ncbi:hypothetical protein PFICI_09313 [Pestalotiopsis fici W106-1]|uniref:Required for respiratory growth protein 9, mitochondrial n=1 Tax=Pestalotiopsis fici (strain W106-1 / CGMCC3.15140) TaxID=1229662 RepID=W3X032_PESFW|nr:uncharacterized protein PFICI_09313 [Pestalotiopsis fici W106-1]ETS79460.1 hypothetical protein PFICI_09313 [Pestalotiopsis fici W106-1]
MACNCRTSSLRIFVQSLTRTQLSGTGERSAGFLNPRPLGTYTTNGGAVKSFTAASAARYPRQHLRTLDRGTSAVTGQEVPSHDTSYYASNTDAGATNASASDIEKARQSNAIFDLSPEAIDALAADASRTPNENALYGEVNGGSQQDPEAYTRRKPGLSGPSRLKRSKIMPAEKPRQHDTQAAIKQRELWQLQKDALKEKFPEGWNPRKKLSPDALDGIRALHTQYPQIYTTAALANQFQVSPEAMRRILKSKWQPNAQEEEKRQERWFNRGKNIWEQMAELGTKPPKRWREAGVTRDARFNKKKGPRVEYPYVPRWKEESAQKKLGDNLM